MIRYATIASSLMMIVFYAHGAPAWHGEIDALFERWDSPGSAGAMVLIMKGDDAAYARGFGLANIEEGIAIDETTRFNVASVSKQFTAACIALLSLEGKVDLDEDIRHYLPYLPEYPDVITVRHLIHHTSGIPDVFGLMAKRKIRFRFPYGNADATPIIAKDAELGFKTGEQYQYSNSNYILLAEIAQKVSGVTLDEYAQEHIFRPLGMRNTRIDDNLNDWAGKRAESYRASRKGTFRHAERIDYIVGDGNVVTTADDLAKWLRNFRTGEVGGKELIKLMKTRGVLSNGETIDYAFGVDLSEEQGRPCIHHSGAWLGFRANTAYFPDDDVSVIILGNHSLISDFNRVAEIYFDNQ